MSAPAVHTLAEAVGGIEKMGAILSACGKYRYRLTREWDTGRIRLGFIMLNPSTADAEIDDPTIRRCVRFARDAGFGGIVVGNLFAWRATQPAELKRTPSPIGPENDFHLGDIIQGCDIVVCAWGSGGALRNRDQHVLRMFAARKKTPHYLRLSEKNGAPATPAVSACGIAPIPAVPRPSLSSRDGEIERCPYGFSLRAARAGRCPRIQIKVDRSTKWGNPWKMESKATCPQCRGWCSTSSDDKPCGFCAGHGYVLVLDDPCVCRMTAPAPAPRVELRAQIVAEIMKFVRQPMVSLDRKPSIAELEAMLGSETAAPIHINPDGSFSVEPPPATVGDIADAVLRIIDAPALEWRCFQCGEIFTDRELAAAHFGYETEEPACRLNEREGGLVAELRAAECELVAYRNEDSAKDREIAGIVAGHHTALRSAEEKGYERGLVDGRQFPAPALKDKP